MVWCGVSVRGARCGVRGVCGAVFRDNAFVNVSCPGFQGKVLMLQINTCVFFLQILLMRWCHKDAIQLL